MATKVVSLYGEIELKDKGFKQGLTDAKSGMGGLKSELTSLAGKFIASGALLGTFTKALDFVVSSAADAETEQVRLEAILKASGGAAGMSADELNRLATGLSNMSGVADEAIIKSEAILLTFRAIGKDIFPEATRAILDMSQAMGMDLQSATIMVGKAMNEPIEGVGALRRVGVMLTDQQKNMIESFMKVNDIAGAQGVILEELNKEFGGVSEAMGSTFEGRINKLKNAFENIGEILGGPVIDGVGAAADGFSILLNTIVELNDKTQKSVPDWNYYKWVIDQTTAVHEEATWAISDTGKASTDLRNKLWNLITAEKVVNVSTEAGADYFDRYKDSIAATGRIAQETADKLSNDLAIAFSDLDWELGQPLSQSYKEINKQQEELSERMAELEGEINKAINQGYNPLGEKVLGLKSDYEKLAEQYNTNAAEHEEATKRILFDLSVQKLTEAGLADPALFKQMAENWGLVLTAEENALIAADDAVNYLKNNPGHIAEFQAIMAGTKTAWELTAEAADMARFQAQLYLDTIDRMKNKTITITTHYVQYGEEGPPAPEEPGVPWEPEYGPYRQHGANFIIPAGYNENYPLGYGSSGERVIVIPKGQGGNTDNRSFTWNVHTNAQSSTLMRDYLMAKGMVG